MSRDGHEHISKEVLASIPRAASFTYDDETQSYYFAPADRADPPYLSQVSVTAVVDVATDGTLGGVEIIGLEVPPLQNQTDQ